MKQENYINISVGKLVTDTLWATVTGLVLTAWFVILIRHDSDTALMLIGTAATASSVAVVAHIRCYTMRVTRLIRTTRGLEPGPSGPAEGSGLRRVP